MCVCVCTTHVNYIIHVPAATLTLRGKTKLSIAILSFNFLLNKC